MESDTYFTHIQNSKGNNGRKENVYTDLFTVSNSRTSLRSGIDEKEHGAGEVDNLYSAIGQPRGCQRRSKIIIGVLVVVVIAVVVAIAVAITAANKDGSSESHGKTIINLALKSVVFAFWNNNKGHRGEFHYNSF